MEPGVLAEKSEEGGDATGEDFRCSITRVVRCKSCNSLKNP